LLISYNFDINQENLLKSLPSKREWMIAKNWFDGVFRL